MALPNTFSPGDVVASAKVNADFNYLYAIVGTSSTSSRLVPPGDMMMGGRANIQLSGKHDVSDLTNSQKFFHIGYNLEYYDSGGGNYKFRRPVPLEIGTSYRFANDGFEIWGVANGATHDPNASMKQFIGFYEDFAYLPETYKLATSNAEPGSNLGDYRTTYVMFNDPPYLYNDATVPAHTATKLATDHGVPSTAVAIMVTARIWTNDSGGARMKFYKNSGSASSNSINGFEVDTDGGGSTKSGAGQGVVPLGVGAYSNQFLIETTANLDFARVVISGYFV